MTGTTIIIIVLIVLLVLVGAIWSTYNGLVKTDERVNEAWSDITVQLKYRADLIPNVVETVKGYAKHESSVFKGVTEARAASISAKTPKEAAEAERSMQGALSKVFAVAEAYPELKSNENFKDLHQKLQDCEDKLQAARRFYNAGAKDLNTKIKLFPSNLINNLFLHFKKRDYFEVADSEKARIAEAPDVKF